MDREIRKRLTWVGMCKETDNGGLVCRRCGISRPTLRQWWRWYQTEGTEGLRSRSRRPKTSRTRKVFEKDVNRILTLRSKRKLGARRIQSELLRQHEFRLNLATIHKVLVKNQVKPLVRLRREEHHKRYSRPISGDRVQMDTCKKEIANLPKMLWKRCSRPLSCSGEKSCQGIGELHVHIIPHVPNTVYWQSRNTGQSSVS